MPSGSATVDGRRRPLSSRVRLAVLVVLTVPAITCAGLAQRSAADAYERELAQLASDAAYRAEAIAEGNREHRAETLARMAEQNALLFQWAVVLLGAVAALVTTSKVHRIARLDLVYALLAPAAVLLLVSVDLGIDFQRSLTFLVSKGWVHGPALNDYLFQQGELLFWALVYLVAFVIVFYISILFGGASPADVADAAGKEAP